MRLMEDKYINACIILYYGTYMDSDGICHVEI